MAQPNNGGSFVSETLFCFFLELKICLSFWFIGYLQAVDGFFLV